MFKPKEMIKLNLDAYPPLLDTQQVADIFGAAKHTIETARSEGTFPILHCHPFKNRIVRYKKSDIVAYLDGCEMIDPRLRRA